jgi:DNA-binding XRE family transcriptional regulator
MIIDENFGDFDALRQEVVRCGILYLQKRELRNTLGKKKSGRHVNDSISHELQRRGIAHFPKNIPMSQCDIVVLTMIGSPGMRQLERFLDAMREDSNQVSRRIPATAAEPSPSIEGGVSASERFRPQEQTCSACGQEYSLGEMLIACPGYWDHPYNYSRATTPYCLACWLGVGPRDVAKMDADHAKQLITKGSTPPKKKWQNQMAELGLTRPEFAKVLGVTDRSVRNWESKGLPTHGTAARMVKETLERMLREREKA